MNRVGKLALTAAFVLLPVSAFAAEGAGEEQRSWLALLFFAINFVLFVAVVVYYAAPATHTFFTQRAWSIRSELDRLSSALKEAETLAQRAAARIAALEDELAKLKRDLDAETGFIADKIRAGAASTADRIRRDTELTVSALGELAARHIRERLARSAAALARDLIARSFRPEDQERLIEGFMDKLREETAR